MYKNIKNSNKLLFGALALIVAGMIVANIFLKTKVKEIREKRSNIEQTDTLTNDSTNNVIQIRIN